MSHSLARDTDDTTLHCSRRENFYTFTKGKENYNIDCSDINEKYLILFDLLKIAAVNKKSLKLEASKGENRPA